MSTHKIVYFMKTEAILMSTHNIGFYEDLLKNIFQLSSNTHLISLFFCYLCSENESAVQLHRFSHDAAQLR